jgi:hypothetical protein
MKLFKFSGRETSVIRAIEFNEGMNGAEILLRTRIQAEECVDILNGLMDAGYVETTPAQQHHVELNALEQTHFEINPAYVHELKKAMVRR